MDTPMEILLQDPSVVVLVKPAGCLSEGGQPNSVPVRLGAQLRASGAPDEVFTVHRLDREVGGLMVLARTHEAASRLISQFAAHRVEKEYLAVVRGVPEQDGAVWEDLLFRDAAKNKSYVVNRPRRGVRAARLEYRLLETAFDGTQPISLVRIRLFTGRTHQIRVQFASRKLPLLGDGRYGGRDDRCPIALFSCRLAFSHPATGRRLCFARPPDFDAFPWRCFSRKNYDGKSPFSTQDT